MSILSEVTQLVDGVDVVSAKDIMDTQETAISAIKKAGEALDKANNMSGVEYDDTELRGLINNKASLDASNLSESNVASWKSKLGVGSGGVSVEVFSSEEEALTASQLDPNKICLY